MAEWDAEIVVSPGLARELIREQFPGLGRTVEPFGSGWDNTAYLVDGELVFRFPRRGIAVALIETEARVLPRIAPHLPLPISCPAWIGAGTERFPWPFAGYRRLAGRTSASVELTPDERRVAAAPLAEFLRTLHAIPMDGLALPGDDFHRTDFTRRMPKLAAALRELEDAGIVAGARRWLRPFEADDLPAPAARPVPVHGDLYELHILVDDAHRVSGVIDWGDVHAGDPGLDLSFLYRFFPAAARDDFLRVYGDVDARTARMARLRAVYHAVVITQYAHSIGDATLLRTARTSLDYVLEE
ncbi:phosphotransferase [Longimicrobium sp.]|uniref:phosphotransferase n=1 Tax=Longimicrobium sp. TaxID=2029185 RepID=UPI002CD2FFA3|nr:phosphotransferase [Longimicrobium sp.]HSU14634.1 phosphotransferase [Longimicrobium sp.]